MITLPAEDLYYTPTGDVINMVWWWPWEWWDVTSGDCGSPMLQCIRPDGGQARGVEDLSGWAGDRRVTRANCSISLKQVVGCDKNGYRTYSTRAATFPYMKQAKLTFSSVFLKCKLHQQRKVTVKFISSLAFLFC